MNQINSYIGNDMLTNGKSPPIGTFSYPTSPQHIKINSNPIGSPINFKSNSFNSNFQ